MSCLSAVIVCISSYIGCFNCCIGVCRNRAQGSPGPREQNPEAERPKKAQIPPRRGQGRPKGGRGEGPRRTWGAKTGGGPRREQPRRDPGRREGTWRRGPVITLGCLICAALIVLFNCSHCFILLLSEVWSSCIDFCGLWTKGAKRKGAGPMDARTKGWAP